jgi:hypothetical protein
LNKLANIEVVGNKGFEDVGINKSNSSSLND